MPEKNYCQDYYRRIRRTSLPVQVAKLTIGSDAPIAIQSMTTTCGKDVEDSLAETLSLVQAGCQLVRITAPGVDDARAFKTLRQHLQEAGLDTPIIADIHYSPEAALEAASHVDKVRINPGNYASAKAVETDEDYAQALADIEERLLPLLNACRERGVAIRLGVNHGSLAPRVVERYGAGVEGMVHSLLELVEICHRNDFHALVLSLKASTVPMMVAANRLLAYELQQRDWNYPIHLGVTEAGEGEDGRTKSAIGIGALLADGIGDTIRVSLSEPPVAEIPVCLQIISTVERLANVHVPTPIIPPYDPYHPAPRSTQRPEALQSCPSGLLLMDFSHEPKGDIKHFLALAGFAETEGEVPAHSETTPDIVLLPQATKTRDLPEHLKAHFGKPSGQNTYRALDASWELLRLSPMEALEREEELAKLDASTMVVLAETALRIGLLRYALSSLWKRNPQLTILIESLQQAAEGTSPEQQRIDCTIQAGAILVDRLAAGLAMRYVSGEERQTLALGILQACELRRAKAEFIACPSCGRTLFDLPETLQSVRTHFGHLRHLKIGVMGCIVNGPGEMADADYGYVGAGPGRVSLYRGQELVKRNIPTEEAIGALEQLLREDGQWGAS
ncbi:MAG: 4-hydroxy-3-methylbut-2-en-1-yl diphosphate synthase [Bacteroidetes bacterium]|nr:MAG: 4-hydroxy-3-methylbut-2-en-1-yl diphosphate synthase [Bacteroidota bacterium]